MIEYFKSIDLHDTPVKTLEIDFYNGVLKLISQHHDDEKNDFFEVKMTFFAVKDLQLEKIDSVTDSEITDFVVEGIPDNYNVEFIFLCDQPFYPVKLSFKFSSVDVNYPSGREPHLQ